jgi:signal peptidase I
LNEAGGSMKNNHETQLDIVRFLEVGILRRILSVLLCLVIFTSCAQELIRDNETKQDINKVSSTEGMNVYQHGYDNVDRGHHEFDGVDIVVDQNLLQNTFCSKRRHNLLSEPEIDELENEFKRTFYGQAHRLGMNVNELIKTSSRSDIADNIRNNFKGNVKLIQESDEFSQKEIKLPNGQYYIIGDDWFRSADSRHFGTISKDTILGKVLGYKE